MIKDYGENLKYIGKNLTLLYRNFIHWNISKILIFLYSNIAGFVLSIPFIAIMVFQYFHTYSSLMTGVDPYVFMNQNFGSLLITLLLLVIIIGNFIATYSYGNFLLLNVYKKYTENSRLGYRENLYFSRKHFLTYCALIGWIGLYLLIPVTVLIALVVLASIAIQMNLLSVTTSYISGNILIGGVSLFIFIAIFAWIINLSLRLSFSYFELLYSEQISNAKTYIDVSLVRTKSKVWKIISFALPFLIILFIISSSVEYFQRSITIQRISQILSDEQIKDKKTDQALLEKYFNGDYDQKEEFVAIEKRYTPSGNSINHDLLIAVIDYLDVRSIDPVSWVLTLIFLIISYLLFEGITSMIFLSIYLILIRKKDEECTENTEQDRA